MSDTGQEREPSEPGDRRQQATFGELLEDSAEDLYENAPCGYLSTLLDGQIAKVNTTLLKWLGYRRDELVGRRSFSDLLTIGGRIYHETHFAPLLSMQGEIGGVALELRAADGTRLPVLITSTVKKGADGQPLLIRTTVFDARDRRAYEQELLRARQEAERERERLQEVLSILQRSLLPPSLTNVPGLQTAAHYHIASADQVGGDFYDLFPLGPDRWGFFLGDVSGKGAEAANITSLIRHTLREAAVHDSDPVGVLHRLNTAVHAQYRSHDPRYCTVIFGVLTRDGDGFTVTLASGGHPPALLLRGDGGAAYLHTPGGLLVGIMAEASFTAATVRLALGDTLMLYTDGLTEARTSREADPMSLYGEQSLLDFATGLAPADAATVITAVRQLLAGFGEGLDDDAAVMALSMPFSGGHAT
ncbi:PAS domain S-box protein [Herbidospora galbida]|uniref:PAS domain S-box protein n=1 Tax=Herbidospora galbida TaxID=2575442 RepID=A0A4U3MN44_9ACTN|nr:SpoIIE family protein phosphatase [Herbidospora galbida]TKK90430.1 PAS domain S-box protein [Herbidospora galbida]